MSEISRRRGMHPLLAFFLGFLFALIILVGAVVGVGYYVLNYDLNKIEANKSVDEEGNTTYLFINADPSSGGVGTVKDLINKISELSKGYSELTLGEIENLIPAMGPLTEKLESELNNYLTLEEGELKEVKLGELSGFVGSLAERVNVAKLIGTTKDNAILVYMSYGVHNLKYNEEEGVWHAKYKDEFAENSTDAEVYDCILEIKDDGKIEGAYYMVDGEKVYTPFLTLENVKDRVGGVCEELTIGEIVPVTEDNRILGSIKNSTVNTISDDINNLCIQQLFADEVYAMKTATDSGDYPPAQMYLAVAEADETPTQATAYGDEDTIYYELVSGNYVLAGNSGKLTQAEFDAYTSGDLYTLGAGKILYDASYLYYQKDEEGDYRMVNAGLSGMGRADAPAAGEEIYTYGGASPLWKLLLYVDEEEQVFTFNNVGAMITNVSKNTKDTPMRELHAAGILSFEGHEGDLELEITFSNGDKQKLGDMPLANVITIVTELIKSPILPPITEPVSES